MPGCQRDDQIAMKRRGSARIHDQTAIRRAPEGRDRAFDLTGVSRVDRVDLHPERRRNATGFMSYEFSLSGKRLELLKQIAPGVTQVAVLRDPTQGGGTSEFAVIQAMAAARATKPAATGSETTGNTIGTVRVACSNGPTVEAPWARMTSGATATSSAACLRTSAALAAAHRVSIRTLRPMLQPNCPSACRNAPTRA